MKKATYLPKNQNTIVVNELDNYFEILLDGEYKTVPKEEVGIQADEIKVDTLDKVKESVFLNCVKNPLSDVIYSLNSNRLVPEPHQYKPLTKFLNSDNNRLLIADEVGLGKTIEAGMIYSEIKSREEIRISMIVVPASLTIKWQEELKIRFGEFFDIFKVNQLLNLIEDFENFSNSKSFDEKIIVSYHTIRDERVIEKLENSLFEVDFLIMDEAHSFRNDETSTFESAQLFTSISEHILFLTATPVQNSIRDIFNVLSLLDNEYFMDFDYFLRMIEPNRVIHETIALLRNNKSLTEIKTHIQENELDTTNTELEKIFKQINGEIKLTNEKRVKLIDKLNKTDHLSFIINRTKKRDVGRLLPRNVKSVIVDISKEEKDFYYSVIDFVQFIHPNSPQGFITIMPERMASSSMQASYESFKTMRKEGKIFIKDLEDLGEEAEAVEIREKAFVYLDRILEKGEKIGKYDSKFRRFQEIVTELHKNGTKQMIVFSFFKNTLNYLYKKLNSFGLKVGMIHGDFTVEERFNIIKSFKKGEFDILLSSEVGSEGLDMQFCNVIINYDLPWNPMRVEQRIGRIDRIGQKFEKLHVFNLCIAGSIEDRIYLRLYDKLNIFSGTVGEIEPVLGDLERELDIHQLLKLSQEEIDQKIHLQKLSVKRRELEIDKQNNELEKLISDDFEANQQKEDLLKFQKLNYLKEHSFNLFKSYLSENNVSFFVEKNDVIRIAAENGNKLFSLLRENMSDKKTNPYDYREERTFLQRIRNRNPIRFSFSQKLSDDFNTVQVNINHPLVKTIAKNKNSKPLFAFASASNLNSGYAVVYRLNINHFKEKSWINTVVLDESMNFEKEIDYFDFIENITNGEKQTVDFEAVKAKASPIIIEQVEKIKKEELENISRLVKVKQKSISTYYDKRISRAKKQEEAVKQEDIVRMKIAEGGHLIEQKQLKLQEIERKKNVSSSFEIISVLKID